MRIAVVGATGRTGRQVVEQALARGHRVTALARRPADVDLRHEHLAVAAADVLDPDRLGAALAGSEAVVSALGVGTSRKATVVYSQGVSNVLGAMQAAAITKLAVVSAAPVGPRDGQSFVERRVLLPVLDLVFGATYDDMRRMEAILRDSDVDWAALRPPRLVDRPATGHYRVQADRALPGARSIPYADLATALLDSLDRDDMRRRAAYVAT